ncbi:MAG TPA: hypothetical protein VIE35_17700 [Dongiaceae bacterium]
MIYLEFIERDRAMPIEIFRQLGNQASAWAEGAQDRMILQLGRTLRLGPAPSYLCLWEIPDLSRLDSWEEYFHSPAARMNNRSLAMHRAIHIQRAGLYDILSRGDPLEAPLHIVEYIDPQGESDDAIRAALTDRARRHAPLRQTLLLRRIGRAGPDPALLCLWAAPDYVSSEPLLRDDALPGMRLMDIGVYRSFGDEIL